ncbi:MAG: WD40 repeat domain-containing protein, partial [Treponema sp.]|nr:WD40 repeat domain-containing protein [Treponema sp.]
EINSRRSIKLPLKGSISAIEESGSEELLFIISSLGEERKTLVAVRLPGTIILEAPFKSKEVFLSRYGPELYVGGDTTLASFILEKR